MDSQELPGTQTQQSKATDGKGKTGKPRGRPRKEPRPEAKGSHAGNVEARPTLTIPDKPHIKDREPEDGRKFAVLPARAVGDRNVSRQAFRVLGVICLHANRNGFTWVGIQKMADILGCTIGSVSVQLTDLKRLGYIEETAAPYYGGPTARTATLRVIYDPTMSAEDVIARNSNLDDDESKPNNPERLVGSTSFETEVVNRKEPTKADLERQLPSLIAEVQARYRSEGLPVPRGDRLAREVADLASIKARSASLA